MYLYEAHMHTAESSTCGHTGAADMVRLFKSHSYDGVIVTDHLYHKGDAEALHGKAWQDIVDHLRLGYDCAAEAGKTLGIHVFYGWEYSNGWCHTLTYGLDFEWLAAHPQIAEMTPEEYYALCRESGGYLVHAHPFRERVTHIQLYPSLTDAVEVINSCRTDEANRRADMYAEMYDFPKTAGSDIHRDTQSLFGCAECPYRLENIHDYIEAVRNRMIVPSVIKNKYCTE